jgi:rare lipoprotein A
MRFSITVLSLLLFVINAQAKTGQRNSARSSGEASWYGEAHRGKLMANGKKFDPRKLTAASWFYPLGTKVKVTHRPRGKPVRIVFVTITDRGPAWDLVHDGRIIDLTHAAFQQLGNPDAGLLPVVVRRVQ